MPPRCGWPGAGSCAALGSIAARRAAIHVVVEQRLGRRRDVRGVGHVVVAVAQADLHRLDDQVRPVGRVHGGELEAVQDAHDLEHRDALRRRRELGDLDVPVRRAHRRCPLPDVGGEVGASIRPPCCWSAAAIASATTPR